MGMYYVAWTWTFSMEIDIRVVDFKKIYVLKVPMSSVCFNVKVSFKN
jgi:hypothetical protein